MKLRSVALLLSILLLATPVMAQTLPRPNILSIAIFEVKTGNKGVSAWCLLVFWVRMPETEYGTVKQGELAHGYAIRLWKDGNKNKAPKIVHRKNYGRLLLPIHSDWIRLSDYRGATDWNDQIFNVGFCGYDEKQKVKLRVRAIDENGNYGKMSKVFTVKLPKFGALGNPKIEGNVQTTGEVRLVYGGNYFWWEAWQQ